MRHARRWVITGAVMLVLLLGWRAFIYTPTHRPAVTASTTAPAPSRAPHASSQSDLILDLFNPSEASLAGQKQETTLVRNIEEAMIASFILRRCGTLSQRDYTDTYRALLAYITATQLASDPTAELQRISASASASYSLLYATTPCDSPPLAVAADTLTSWRKAMLND